MPDTAADFMGLFFNRIAAVYHKPIFIAAGNDQLIPPAPPHSAIRFRWEARSGRRRSRHLKAARSCQV